VRYIKIKMEKIAESIITLPEKIISKEIR